MRVCASQLGFKFWTPTSPYLFHKRDVFLAKSVEDAESCDWHVDDLGFWPESFIPAADGIYGVNIWLALDDVGTKNQTKQRSGSTLCFSKLAILILPAYFFWQMPALFQGSMAVAPQSHTATWRHRAYSALGQNRSQDGGKTKEEVIRKVNTQRQQQNLSTKSDDDASQPSTTPKSKYPTCDLRLVDPDVAEILDASQQVLDIQLGDVIFATRLLFHRTMPVTNAGVEYYQQRGQEHLSRYSIRYVPGTARLPKGWSVEWSVVDDNTNAGHTLDTVVEQADKLFYPQVWPSLEESLSTRLNEMEIAVPSLSKRAHEEYMATIFGSVEK